MSADDQSSELTQLERFFLQSRDGFAIGFARSISTRVREKVLTELSARLEGHDTSLEIVDFQTEQIHSLFKELSARKIGEKQTRPMVFVNLEKSIFAKENGHSRFLHALNLDRDRFRRTFKVPILFWMTPSAADKLQEEAHDFYDYWSGVFDFTKQNEIPPAETPASLERISSSAPEFLTDEEINTISKEVERHFEILEELGSLDVLKGKREFLRALESLITMAKGERRLGNYPSAQDYLDKALSLANKSNDQAKKAECLQEMSQVALAQNNFNEAKKHLQSSISIYRKLIKNRPEEFLPELAKSLNNLGRIYSELSRQEDALKMAREAVILFSKLTRSLPTAFVENLANSRRSLSSCLKALGKDAGADEVWVSATELLEEHGKLLKLA